ncbi:MAG: thiamine-binding protein [Sulfurimonas sp.]|nr:MAG: thiamine-binding protein [Sulfurimonas sp.]
MSVLLEFSMFPTSGECREGASVSKYVSRIIDMIDKSGVAYQLTPMGTVIETDTMKEALEIIERAYATLECDCERVYASLKFDIRQGASHRLQRKIASVEEHLQRKVVT